MGRLFTAIELPSDIAIALEIMRGGIEGARWIDRENYHITLRFIGEVDGGMERELIDALNGVRCDHMELRLKGVDHFGGSKPRALWAGVEDDGTLRDLHSAQERLCQQLGIAPEQRKFTPHVTLARLRQSRLNEVERYVLDHSLFETRFFTPERFVLLSSRPSRGGGPYSVEEIYPI